MVENRSWVLREGVYRWFSSLTSARRTEFLCGLLDLCVPIELRFLGSCLEDLARKDYSSLRDAEIKANNPADLSALTDITDDVVRSKLLVSLALLASDNREAAGVLYRTLTHVDTVINNYGLPLNETEQTEEQFLLLFTMASNHPAFSFHQKQLLRQELRQIQDILQVGHGSSAASAGDTQCPGSHFPDGGAACHGQPPLHHHPAPPPPPHNRLHQTTPAPPPAPHRRPGDRSDPAAYPPPPACRTLCSCWHKKQTREAGSLPAPSVTGRGDRVSGQHLNPPSHPSPPPLCSGPAQDGAAPAKSHQGKAGRVVIEKVEVRSLTRTADDPGEYTFEAHWLDGCVSSVVRTQQEVAELLSQLADAFPEEGLDKLAPPSLELDPRCLTALSSHVLQHRRVHLFLTPSSAPLSPTPPPASLSSSSSSPPSLPPSPPSPPVAPVAPAPCTLTCSTKLGSLLQYRGTNRAAYSVASVQPAVSLHSSFMTRSLPQLSSLPPSTPASVPLGPHSPQMLPLLPPASSSSSSSSSSPASTASASIADPSAPHSAHSYGPAPQSHSQQHGPAPGAQFLAHPHHCQPGGPLQPHPAASQAQAPAHPSQGLAAAAATPPEPNGILDWLRRLRLHKYYPVFKQLTMEEFLALTEEDLNTYDLTQGAKKKLKTQLELHNREIKLEKRYATPQFPGSCGGIAMVTPSSHMRPSLHPTSTGELRVEVDAGAHHHQAVPVVPRDGSSSSGYSSSVGSPRSPLRRSTAFDRTKEVHRPLGSGPEKERACVLLLASSSGRPTAQVLPVQTDPPPPLPPQPPPSSASPASSSSSLCHPVFSLGSLHPHHHPSYPHAALLATAPHPPPHILASPRKLRPLPLGQEDRTKAPGPPGSGAGPGMGLRLDGLFSVGGRGADGLPDSVACRGLMGGGAVGLMGGGAVGLMVDTSSALTSTSNSLHHVSHPPVHFHLSSSPSPSAYYSYPAGASSFSSIFSSSCFAPYSSSASSSSKLGSLAACNSGGGGGGGGGGGVGYAPMATGNNTVPVPGSYCSPPVLISSPSPSPPSSSSSSSSSSCSSSLDFPSGANHLGHAPSACACSSCGCHGGCGAFGALPGYAAAGYLRPFSAAAGGGPSLFTLGPLLHFSPLIASSSSSSSSTAGAPGGGPFSYPLVAPQALYRHGVMSHDHLHQHHHHQHQHQQQQQGCGAYASQEALRSAAASAKRAAGNVSCYNCGVGGHRAEDCKQPPMDAQQGTFRLKYIPRPDSQDSGE